MRQEFPGILPKLWITLSIVGLMMVIGMLTRNSHAQTESSPAAQLVNTLCAACHKTGAAGAPILGDKAQWASRVAKGEDEMIKNALNGFKAMPPKGGNVTLDDGLVKDAVLYMLAQLDSETKGTESGAEQSTGTEKQQPASAENAATEVDSQQTAVASLPSGSAETQQVGSTAAPPTTTVKQGAVAPENTFNRLIRPASDRNRPPSRDGIHDPDNPATELLQPPGEAFAGMPRSQSGNYIDWVEALDEGHIKPRVDAQDPTVKPTVIDMNIVREVKGSMPNVVYPHKAHTEWLDCSNCHPALFEPRKGANQMSMAAIILGEKCGVCHGKVAFPVAECRRCHSQKKQPVSQSSSAQ